jgi:hypothetical protein
MEVRLPLQEKLIQVAVIITISLAISMIVILVVIYFSINSSDLSDGTKILENMVLWL